MSRVTQIDIHFTMDGVERIATIRPQEEPGRRVQQILLDRPGPFKDPRPAAITLDGEEEPEEGKGPQVCYRIDNQLVCW
jgi:hypothetical protein